MVPYEAFLAEKPVVTTTDAGGPLEVVTDGHRPRRRAARRGGRGGVRAAQRRRRRGLGRAGHEIAQRVNWDATIDRLLCVRVAYYSPLPPSRSGIADYSALLLPALAGAAWTSSSRGPAASAGHPKADVALYHVGNDPDEHGWIVEALAAGRAWSSCTSSCSTTSSPGSRSPAATSRATAPRSSARRARRAAQLGARRPAGRIEPLWETRAHRVPARARVLDLATGLIVHSRTSRASPATPATTARSGRCRCPPGPCRRSSRRRSRAARSSAASATSTRASASRSCSRRSRGSGRTRGCCSSAPGRRACRRSSCRRDVIRRDYVPEDELWRLLAACDAVVSLRWPTMGETSAAAVRALSRRQAARRQRRRRVPRAARRGRDQGAGRRRRDRRRWWRRWSARPPTRR